MIITGHAMRIMGKLKSIKAIVIVLAFLGSGTFSSVVWADITPFLDGVTGAAPAFTFGYHIVIGGGEVIQTGITNPGAPPATTAASGLATGGDDIDRKSTRLNSSHSQI